MKRIYLLFLLAVSLLSGQSPDKSAISGSGNYYYGSAVSESESEARDAALAELTEQIAVTVANSFESKLKESGDKLDTSVNSVLRTHSQATLRNVKSIKSPTDDGRIEVFCYLLKSEVEKIFEARRRLIADITANADKYEAEGNIAFALKLYYFGIVLCNSIPDEALRYRGVNYTTELPERINHILLNTRFSLVRKEQVSAKEKRITLSAKYNGQPLALLDFFFWDGSNQVAVQGRDGLATFSLLGASTNFEDLKLNIKYAYYEARSEYDVVRDLWDLVQRPSFKSNKTVSLAGKSEKAAGPVAAIGTKKAVKREYNLNYEGQLPVAETIIKKTDQLLNLLTAGDVPRIRAKYSHDRYLSEKITSYLKYNHPKALDGKIDAAIHKTQMGYELRRIRMAHKYPSLHKQTTEYMVLDFSDSGELLDLNMSITEPLYNRFVKESDFSGDWNRRQQIIKFVEKYRTAYINRDIGTVDLMFAEEALIIIGRKIKKKPQSSDAVKYQQFRGQPGFEYLKLTKRDYLERQKSIFNSQQDIFLDFGSFDIIRKNNAENVYGVEMRQSYTSTTYSDEGYLFLLIDFSERDPLIYVRAWQPNEWSDSSMVKTANYRIYK